MADDRLIEIASELLIEVQSLRKDLKQDIGELRTDMNREAGQLRRDINREVGQLRADMNRNHAKAMAGLMEVRTSVIKLAEQLSRLINFDERLRKPEATVYGKTG